PDELMPTEFAHAKLFVPMSKPVEEQTAMNAATEGAVQPTAKLAEATIEHPDRVPSDAATDPIRAAPMSSEAVKPWPTIDPPKPLWPRYKVTDQPLKPTGQVAVSLAARKRRFSSARASCRYSSCLSRSTIRINLWAPMSSPQWR